jgi:phosphonoacetaldehyde hydrolase
MLLNPVTPHGSGATRIRAAIFDWAGTTVDFGSLAPVRTLERVFAEAGITITEIEARRDMGIAKRDHISALLATPRIRAAWLEKFGHSPDKKDRDALYERFLPLQMACLKEYSQVIRGIPEVTTRLQTQGIKIGSTTGYTRSMLDILMAQAAEQGYQPDCSLSPEDVNAGRPHPFMIYAAAIQLQVYPLAAFVKVGDTESDIQEGLNAGVWSVGVVASGNGVGLSEETFLALSVEDRVLKLKNARQKLQAAGAHYVVDTLSELDGVFADINALLHGKNIA